MRSPNYRSQPPPTDSTDEPTFYVTGHSLGGAEAEDVAAQLQSTGITVNGVTTKVAVGGVTFAAPGVASLLGSGVLPIAPGLTNYVIATDAVGEFGTHVNGIAPLWPVNYLSNVLVANLAGGPITYVALEIATSHLLSTYGQALADTNRIPTNPITPSLTAADLLQTFNYIQSTYGTVSTAIASALVQLADDIKTRLSSTENSVASGLSQFEQSVVNMGNSLLQTYQNIVSSGTQSGPNLTTLHANIVNFLQQSGYYITQPGDTGSSIVSALSAGGAFNSIDAAALQRINAAFGVTDFSTPGILLHVPVTGSGNIGFFGGALPTVLQGQTLVFDPSNNTTYTVGASLDGHDSGALIIDRADFAGNYPTFAAGTYSNVSMQPNGTINVTLIEGDPVTLGNLAISPSGSSTLTLTDGTVISVPGNASPQIANTLLSTATPEAVLESYLQQLGATNADTAAALDTAHEAFLTEGPAAKTFTFGNGSTITLDQGTYASAGLGTFYTYSGYFTGFGATLTNAQGEVIGTLLLDPTTGAGTLTENGSLTETEGSYFGPAPTYTIPAGTSLHLTAPDPAVAPLQALTSYINELGATALSQPIYTPYNVNGQFE